MLRPLFALALLAFSSTLLAIEPDLKNDHLVRYKTEDSYTNIKESVQLAITEKGLVINSVSHIGEMLERTGQDLGTPKKIYQQAEALEFCSAVASRRMMDADPHNIIFCPYIIAIYVTPQEPNMVYVAYRRPAALGDKASREALKAVEELLDSIVRAALDW